MKPRSAGQLYGMPDSLWSFCADIGSVKSGRFGWFGLAPDGSSVPGRTIEDLASAVAEKITAGEKVALGFECPLFVPVRTEPMLLTSARNGEGNRSWSATAGCCVLGTGLVEVQWLLASIRANVSESATAFLDWHSFVKSNGGLFLWEAFVSGKAKGNGHAHDAEIAVRAFRAALPNPPLANAITEQSVFSLVGAGMLRAGWSSNVQLLSEQCLVIKA